VAIRPSLLSVGAIGALLLAACGGAPAASPAPSVAASKPAPASAPVASVAASKPAASAAASISAKPVASAPVASAAASAKPAASAAASASTDVKDATGKSIGTATFSQVADGVIVSGTVQGLPAGPPGW